MTESPDKCKEPDCPYHQYKDYYCYEHWQSIQDEITIARKESRNEQM